MSRSARQAAADEFRRRMRRSNELHRTYLDEPGVPQQYDRFAAWQMAYLLTYFDDLHERPGYGEAIDFTISDLAGVRISGRDDDLERAAPVITRMLPGKALETLAAAAKLNAHVLEFNLGVFRRLQIDGELPDRIGERAYCVACRSASTLDECLELVHVAVSLGTTLKTLIKVPLLGGLLRTMRGPAHAAGFGALHDFLESGYTNFKAIPDINHFLGEIDARMTDVFTMIYTTPLDELD